MSRCAHTRIAGARFRTLLMNAWRVTWRHFHVVLIAIPILIQVYFNSSLAYGLMKPLKVEHWVVAPGALIGASNFFELARRAVLSRKLGTSGESGCRRDKPKASPALRRAPVRRLSLCLAPDQVPHLRPILMAFPPT